MTGPRLAVIEKWSEQHKKMRCDPIEDRAWSRIDQENGPERPGRGSIQNEPSQRARGLQKAKGSRKCRRFAKCESIIDVIGITRRAERVDV